MQPAYIGSLDKSANNLNLIRLLAAVAVIYAHSYAFMEGSKGELIARLTGVTHAGELSVAVFFFLSGALITRSLIRSDSAAEFLVKRVARIYPALVVCCFFVAYAMPLALGEANLTTLLGDRSFFNYFLSNSVGIWNVHFIPGVFEERFQKALNGSLWSITLELRLYLIWTLLALLGLMNTLLLRCLSLAGLLVLLATAPNLVPLIGSDHSLYGGAAFPGFSAIFVLGGFFCLLERRLRIEWSLACAITLGLLLITKGMPAYRFSVFAFVISFAMWLATLPAVVKRFRLRHDYSYGVYLYGWPAQQIALSLLAANRAKVEPWQLTLVSIPLALGLAAASWHLIEKPALALVPRVLRALEHAKRIARLGRRSQVSSF